MPRLIDADAVVTCQTYDDEHEEWGEETLAIADALDKWADEGCPPTIDAEPVRHGRWEWRENWGAALQDPSEILDAGWACSACGTDLLPYLQSHFPDIPSYVECASEENPTIERCPCCGAKMDGGAEDAKATSN